MMNRKQRRSRHSIQYCKPRCLQIRIIHKQGRLCYWGSLKSIAPTENNPAAGTPPLTIFLNSIPLCAFVSLW